MRGLFLIAAVLVAADVINDVYCMTNQEFFDMVKEHAEDLQSFDLDDPAIDDDDDEMSDVIELPGDATDEMDMEYLLSKLDLPDILQNIQEIQKPAKTPNDNLGWWKRRRRRRRRRPHRRPCTCHRYVCSCCLRHIFKIKILFKRWRFRVNVCVRVGYLRRDHGFFFTITYNNRRLFHREISLRHPPSLCYGVPGLKRFVSACIEIYNINLRAKRMCLRASFIINVRIKKFRWNLKIACFRIPLLDQLEQDGVMGLLENMESSVENTDTGEVTEVSMSDLPALYRQFQVDVMERHENENSNNNDGQVLEFEPSNDE